MQAGSHSHLATIEPIEPSEAKRVMNYPSLIFHNVVFVALQTGWIWLSLACWYLSTAPVVAGQELGLLLLLISVAWLAAQFVVVFVYPEWPMNRRLSARLRRHVADRTDRPNWVTDPDLRVVELVPRERWNRLLLDTATDLLLLRVDSAGVMMEGDCDRYALPAESILGVELESIRPSGWFTDTHMVVIYARTDAGPVELPISYRDHQFGGLRNLRRRDQAMELVHRITNIAKGQQFQPLSGTERPRESTSLDANPYAPPMIPKN
jgi:hypothetical protein